jgi:hypothetical protein
MSETVLEPYKSKDPENDTYILWDLAIRRVTDAKREDEVLVSDELTKLGVDIAFRAAVLAKEAVGDTESKAMLTKLFGQKIYLPSNVAARINSLFAYRELTTADNKKVKLSVLDKAIRGLHDDPTAPIDYSTKGLHVQTTALLKTQFALSSKYLEFEGETCVREVGDVTFLHPVITTMVKRTPNRYAAIVELVGKRRVKDRHRVLEMLEVSESNALMDGAL